MKIAILGSTKGTDMQYILDAVDEGRLKGVSIEVVISNKPAAYILERAKKAGIEAVYIGQKGKTREEFDDSVMKILDTKKIELVLLIGFMRFLSKEFVEKWRWKIINVHPSLLPRYGGGMDKSVHEAVLENGERETGMTIHFVDEGADTGPIIIQKKCQIVEGETVESLKAKVQELEGEGYVEVLEKFRDGKIKISENKLYVEQ